MVEDEYEFDRITNLNLLNDKQILINWIVTYILSKRKLRTIPQPYCDFVNKIKVQYYFSGKYAAPVKEILYSPQSTKFSSDPVDSHSNETV